MRRLLPIVAVAVMLVLAGCSGSFVPDGSDSASDDDSESDDDLEVHHIDVGQADSTLLNTPEGETILIDTGDWRDDGEAVIDYLEARGIDRIDHLVATHGHADHVGGHAAVIEHFEEHGDGVGAAYDSGVVQTTATYDRYLDAIEAHDVTLYEVDAGDELPLDDEAVEGTVLNPPEGASDDVDANGIVLSVEYDSFSYLTTGDAESTAESRLVEEWGDESALEADVYQAGHHGSSTSSTPRFLDAVDPRIAVISSALESQYGHPHDEVLEAFAERGIETYWTGVHGDVVVTTDGESVAVETERDASTDPDDLLEAKSDASDGSDASLEGPSIETAPAPTARR
ncbi:ComEC/Rec2 family competence protein [Natrialbaceae archaeon GCM10025810]|uniref:ComEC/Rec2 family competence protein n=1 Tax=Halovalidus salilacus TaxID=3075124 RepID=UPI003621ED79